MKRKLPWVFLLLYIIAFWVVVCCFVGGVITLLPVLGILSDLMPKENSCLSALPPDGFSEADLVGTWVARRLGDSDTLIIRDDGTYKQIIHVEYTDYTDKLDVDYESDWQPWWLEYHESGIPYLHLKGMRFCAINPSFSCDQPTGYQTWHGFCEDTTISTETIAMDNEGILLVLGVSEEVRQSWPDSLPPRGINLWFPMGSEDSWSYSLQEP